MKKIGILGGTFDPIHVGHLVAADQAMFYAGLDEVWFMPANVPPHKQNLKVSSIYHRIKMIEGVVEIDPRYKLCSIELEREGPSFTLDTVKALKNKYPDISFSFIIGADMVQYLPKWHGIDELIQLITFIGLARPGYELSPIIKEEEEIYNKVNMIPMPQLEISSSEIRSWIKLGRPIRYVVPKNVENYIKEQQLYED